MTLAHAIAGETRPLQTAHMNVASYIAAFGVASELTSNSGNFEVHTKIFDMIQHCTYFTNSIGVL